MVRMKSCKECRLAIFGLSASVCDCGYTLGPIDQVESWEEHYVRVAKGEKNVPEPRSSKVQHWLPCTVTPMVTYRDTTLRRLAENPFPKLFDAEVAVDGIPIRGKSRLWRNGWIMYRASKESEVYLPSLLSHIVLVLRPYPQSAEGIDKLIDQIIQLTADGQWDDSPRPWDGRDNT